MRSEQEYLQELVADLAEAIQAGLVGSPEDGWVAPDCSVFGNRFSCEVVDFNRVDVIDSDGREYVVIVKEKEKE